MRKTLIVVAGTLLGALVLLKFALPIYANRFLGLGIDLPIPISWVMHPPIMFFVVLGIFVLGISSAAGWILFRRMKRN